MKRYEQIDPKALKSWVGKPIRDSRLNVLGLVVGYDEEPEAILYALFPGEKTKRTIFLKPKPSLEFIEPGNVRARYRPPTKQDREKLLKKAKS